MSAGKQQKPISMHQALAENASQPPARSPLTSLSSAGSVKGSWNSCCHCSRPRWPVCAGFMVTRRGVCEGCCTAAAALAPNPDALLPPVSSGRCPTAGCTLTARVGRLGIVPNACLVHCTNATSTPCCGPPRLLGGRGQAGASGSQRNSSCSRPANADCEVEGQQGSALLCLRPAGTGNGTGATRRCSMGAARLAV